MRGFRQPRRCWWERQSCGAWPDRSEIAPKCDAGHGPAVRPVTAPAEITRHIGSMVNRRNMGAGMLIRSFARLTTAAVVVAAALLFAVPFLFALISPFIGR
jgi:hypothetical protein